MRKSTCDLRRFWLTDWVRYFVFFLCFNIRLTTANTMIGNFRPRETRSPCNIRTIDIRTATYSLADTYVLSDTLNHRRYTQPIHWHWAYRTAYIRLKCMCVCVWCYLIAIQLLSLCARCVCVIRTKKTKLLVITFVCVSLFLSFASTIPFADSVLRASVLTADTLYKNRAHLWDISGCPRTTTVSCVDGLFIFSVSLCIECVCISLLVFFDRCGRAFAHPRSWLVRFSSCLLNRLWDSSRTGQRRSTIASSLPHRCEIVREIATKKKSFV